MTKKQKLRLVRILSALVLFIALLIVGACVEVPWYIGVILMAVPYIIAGWDILFEAFCKLFSGQVFDECLLMSIASLGAMALCFIESSAHTAHEAAAIMIFYQLGELFQSVAVGKSRRSVKDLLALMPDKAAVERDGRILSVDPEEVGIGEIIVVLPGERIALDGCVVEGSSSLDTASLTGESLPRDVIPGDEVLSGCINLSGKLRVKTTRSAGESTASKIMELVENAGIHKSNSEKFISKFSRVYTPFVVLAAVLAALIPSFIVGFTSGVWGFSVTWKPYVHAALMFLIVSCPCAIVISVPLSFFASIGAAGKRGVLIKGSAYVDALSKIRTVIFDKTGTLTKGKFAVTSVRVCSGTKEELLRVAAALESGSNHPIARAVCAAYEGDLPTVSELTEHAGKGVSALINGKRGYAGNLRLMEEAGVTAESSEEEGSAVYVCLDGSYLGFIVVSDALKDDSAAAVSQLKDAGVRCVMLTGDRKENAERTAAALGIEDYRAELLPADKVEIADAILKEKPSGSTVAFVGDGINDAPVLAGVDVGVAMGALGSDAAIEAADVVLAGDRPSDLPFAIRLAKKTMRLVRENIVFALAVKFTILALLLLMTFVPALSGMNDYAGEFAVFADVGVSVIAILNAMRSGR